MDRHPESLTIEGEDYDIMFKNHRSGLQIYKKYDGDAFAIRFPLSNIVEIINKFECTKEYEFLSEVIDQTLNSDSKMEDENLEYKKIRKRFNRYINLKLKKLKRLNIITIVNTINS